ncbi:hypothetical protein [Silvibacterium dinghuense]|uniref:Uncharacterized protein n=1 Tax=Silvibacterium dinghuense TaxID=1560006 RepID=A0A4V1NW28_9BACT|nr:hypothetical protein [Silvibacterium dinghuense]RXS97972.1 hypothetical protein ESZ00_09020 [Silvibacterium dinghuense]GGH03478.1 hypothetical protein GCM10011586_19290 [Silvibacterium dinghuense]
MPTHNPHDVPENNAHGHPSPEMQESLREGYEVTDVSAQGILVFLVGLLVTVGVFFLFCFGMGKVINNVLQKSDGPVNKWNASSAEPAGKLRNMEPAPVQEQQELHQLTQKFPTPRLETDDGNQDLADLHRREDLLLDHYSWIDDSHTKVRIPIDRAMELIAQRGLPVAPAVANPAPLMTGDAKPVVQVPLTDGFAPTAFEQEENSTAKLAGEQASSKANNN